MEGETERERKREAAKRVNGGRMVKHRGRRVRSNPKARRVNWMECLSSQLAISNYSVSKWMEDGGGGRFRFGWSRADGAINEPIG